MARRSPTIGLPFQSTPCIGRDTELSTIARLLSDPGCRLLTLLGPGGIGKTRLALEIAARQTDLFSDGVAFIPLVSIDTPDQILSVIADILSLSIPLRTDLHTHLLGYLSERHMLLVFDTFEHLLEGAELVAEILAHAPRVTALVTSHERLNLQAEWLFDVDGLAYPPEDPHALVTPQSLADLSGSSAVQLFVQRARQIQPGFPLSEPTLTTIVRICQHVAGIPLAIELAAANVRLLPIAEIERQIRTNLDGLATTLRDVPERHRSMHAVFDHSWNLLREPERVLFSRLAVFRGGCTAAAAEHVAGATLAGLTTLIDKSLVRQVSAAPAAVNAKAEPRFVLLEPIREYALGHLIARGEAEDLLRAHAVYYLALAEAAAAAWNSPSAEAKIAGLDREVDNLRAVLQWARDGGDLTLGLRLGGALSQFWRRRGASAEGRVWLEELLAVEEATADAAAKAARLRAIQAAAWLASD